MILERLRGLIVSIQPEAKSVLNSPETVALLARCAVASGAAAVRIQGTAHIAAVRAAVDVPIVGLIKRAYPGFEPYITVTAADAAAIVAAGADIVAFDATPRPRPDALTIASLIASIHAGGAVAMADCATADEVRMAVAAGAEIAGTTLSGYTAETQGRSLPAFDVLDAAVATGAFAILEGGVAEPAQLRAGFAAGAGAVVVGTALTNIDARIRAFATSVPATEVRDRKSLST
jgi:N-acylglucosamine-6-phosphate 2-epimerase